VIAVPAGFDCSPLQLAVMKRGFAPLDENGAVHWRYAPTVCIFIAGFSRKVATRQMERLYSRPFALCALANFAQAVSFSLFLHFPGFLKELGAGESTIGVLVALTALAAVALGPFVGRLMDRRGRRPVIVSGNLLNVGVVGLYLTVHALSPAVYVVRLLHGVAETMLYSALFTYAADMVPPARTAQGLALFGVSAMPRLRGGVIRRSFSPVSGARSQGSLWRSRWRNPAVCPRLRQHPHGRCVRRSASPISPRSGW
jgi:hypothetical protein